MGRIALLDCSGIVVCAVFGIMIFESSFIYFPAKFPEGDWSVSDESASFRVEDVYFKAADNVNLHGWYCAPQRAAQREDGRSAAERVILFLHGNAGNISHRRELIGKLMNANVSIFIVDYRGYGRSEGAPSEQGLYADALGAWNYLTVGRGIGANRIVIFGESLGGAVAIQLATEVQPAGLVVQSSFTSISDMARRVMPFVPRFLLRTKMDSLKRIRSVQCPKLFIHSRTDEIVPFEMGRRLFDAASEPKHFYIIERASHNEANIIGGAQYFNRINRFIQACATL